MQGLEKLKELADKLPKEVKSNAVALVTKMGEVIEGIGDKPVEWRPDMARIIQPSSDRSKLGKNVNIGSIVLGETVVEQPLKVIALRTWNARQYWSPDKDEARILCSSPDGLLGYTYGECKGCDYGKFNTETNRSDCNKVKTVMCITADLSRIFQINFTKTNYSAGLDWEKLMKKAGVSPYKRLYDIRTETSKKHKNVESLIVETHNENTPVEYLPFLETLFLRVGSDREEYRVKFYEMVKLKQADGNLLEHHVSSEDEAGTVVPSISDATPQQAAMSKKYEL